jgi:hypothetical protein
MSGEFTDELSKEAAYFLTTPNPISPGQLEWENEIRPRAEALLLERGAPILPAHFPHRLAVARSEINFIRQYKTGAISLTFEQRIGRAIHAFFSKDSAVNFYNEDYWDRVRMAIEDTQESLPRLEIRTLAVPFRDYTVLLKSHSQEIDAKLQRALNDRSVGKNTPLPNPPISSLELSFHSGFWGPSDIPGNTEVISPAGRDYKTTDYGLELPAISKTRIEHVLEYLEQS